MEGMAHDEPRVQSRVVLELRVGQNYLGRGCLAKPKWLGTTAPRPKNRATSLYY